jgi:hypothetical protein
MLSGESSYLIRFLDALTNSVLRQMGNFRKTIEQTDKRNISQIMLQRIYFDYLKHHLGSDIPFK